MKVIISLAIACLFLTSSSLSAQEKTASSEYGNTVNLGVGFGYYSYVQNTMPVFHANFEIDAARNFTLAPFISYYSYQNDYYWGDHKNPNKYYYYRVTVIPIGVKGSYYFDNLLKANTNWDFYLAGSLGFAMRKTSWENGYNGDRSISHGSSGLYLDLHIGTEYHLNSKFGLQVDLSTGLSTIGLAVHL